MAAGCADGGDENGASQRLCVCGHGKKAHLHYRRGTECALCDCSHWSGDGLLSRLLRRRRPAG